MKILAYLVAAAGLAVLVGCSSTPGGATAAASPAPAAAPPSAPASAAPPPAAAAPVNAASAETILNTTCSSCHASTLATDSHRSRGEWETLLNEMMSRGASLSDADYNTLLAYLVINNGR